MAKKFRWILRLIFLVYMVYVYFAVYRQGSFYSFLLLNTFLGYIPIELAMHINSKEPKLFFWPLFIFWLLFYPNAPYVLTDLFHLAKLNPYNPATGLMALNIKLWWNFSVLAISALGCALMGMWSLEHVSNICAERLNRSDIATKITLIIIFNIISSFGIYIGRFLRLHTAYIFMEPSWVFRQLATMWNAKMVMFVILIFLVQVTVWGSMEIYRLALNKAK